MTARKAWNVPLVSVAVLGLAWPALGAPQRTAFADEPFETFRAIDSKLFEVKWEKMGVLLLDANCTVLGH